jgi:alkylation response protein AidB-like acyl-CoA dehydrogenase
MFDLDLTPEQEQLCDTLAGLLRSHCEPAVVRAAEPLGFSAELWERIRPLGLVEMTLTGDGGGGADLADLALACEALGAALAPVPLVEAAVAARLLGRLGGGDAARLLAEQIGGGALTTISLRPLTGGVAVAVPAGAVARGVLARRGGDVVVLDGPAPTGEPEFASLPVADRPADDATVLASGPEALEAYELAVSEWRALTAALLCGAARRTLDLAVAYTRERHAFGVPIGSFQSIAHRLADGATNLDGAELLAREAAWAFDHDPDSAAVLASMAFQFVGETAERLASDALHFHGGYGFMLEYDVQLYFRRIKGWLLLAGDRRREPERLADLLLGPAGEER